MGKPKIIFDRSEINRGGRVKLKPEAREIYQNYMRKNEIDRIFNERPDLIVIDRTLEGTYIIKHIEGIEVLRKHFEPVVFDLHVFSFYDVFFLAPNRFIIDYYFRHRPNLIANPKRRRQIDKTGTWEGLIEVEKLKEVPDVIIRSWNNKTRIVRNYQKPENEIRIY